MVTGVWCQESGAKGMASKVWCQAFGARHLVAGASGVWCLASGAWRLASGRYSQLSLRALAIVGCTRAARVWASPVIAGAHRHHCRCTRLPFSLPRGDITRRPCKRGATKMATATPTHAFVTVVRRMFGCTSEAATMATMSATPSRNLFQTYSRPTFEI